VRQTGGSPAEEVQRALAALAAGRMVVVVDAADRENEGDLVVAAELATEEQMAFIVRHTTGIVCAPMTAERCAALRLPQMVADNTDAHGTAFTVSVDHVDTGTGVSAACRARTVQALADPATPPARLLGDPEGLHQLGGGERAPVIEEHMGERLDVLVAQLASELGQAAVDRGRE
jgi:3,4-dihydroxy 2-butanone 4-phosphate synthase/GTP cyclohydrolase II